MKELVSRHISFETMKSRDREFSRRCTQVECDGGIQDFQAALHQKFPSHDIEDDDGIESKDQDD